MKNGVSGGIKIIIIIPVTDPGFPEVGGGGRRLYRGGAKVRRGDFAEN